MDTTKRIEIAARLLANMMPELLSATDETRAKLGRQALDWVDALEEVAIGDRPEVTTQEYPWDTAPDWANWAATDENGSQHWYDLEPTPDGDNMWVVHPGSKGWVESDRFVEAGAPCPNWRNTLQPRPEAPHA